MKKLFTFLLLLPALRLGAQQNWQLLNTGIPTNIMLEDFAADGNTLYIFGWVRSDASPKLYKTTNDGASWNEVMMNFDSSGYKASSGFIVNNGKMLGCFFKDLYKGFYIAASMDGTNWKWSSTGTAKNDILVDLVALDNQTLLAAGYKYSSPNNAVIYKSIDNGVTWAALTISGIPSGEQIMCLEKMGDRLLAATEDQSLHRRLYYSTDGGENWYGVLGGLKTMQVHALAGTFGQSLYTFGTKKNTDDDDVFRMQTSTSDGDYWNDYPCTGIDSAVDFSIRFYNSPNYASAIYHTSAYYLSIGNKIYKSTPDTWPAGINNVSKNNLKLYPNPATAFITLEIETENTAYQVSDAQGHMVASGNYEKGRSIDVSGLVSGIYFIRCTQGEKVVTSKFIKE